MEENKNVDLKEEVTELAAEQLEEVAGGQNLTMEALDIIDNLLNNHNESNKKNKR